MTDVKVRDACPQCHGDGMGGISRHKAEEMADEFRPGVIAPGQMSVPSRGERIRKIMECPNCEGYGYIENWVSLNELLSIGL